MAVRWTGGRRIAGAGLLLAGSLAAAAQSAPSPQLVVWAIAGGSAGSTQRLAGGPAVRPALPVLVPPLPPEAWRTYHEQTAGSYGVPASQVGQTAASYGQTAGSVGSPAADYGQTAGSYGQTAASFGTTAGSVGQTAASYGVVPSEFGQTAGSYGVGLSDVNKPAEAMNAAPAPNEPARGVGAFWLAELRRRYGSAAAVRVVEVPAQRLVAELERTAGTAEAPDALLAQPLPGFWRGDLAARWALTVLARDRVLAVSEVQQGESPVAAEAQVAVMRNAPHMDAALGFAGLVADGLPCLLCGSGEDPGPRGVAEAAYKALLVGGSMSGLSDAQAASMSASAAQRGLFREAGAGAPPAGTQVQVVALGAWQSARLAVVALRAGMAAPGAWGIVHGVAVLRPDARGNWRVLALASNVPPAVAQEMAALLGGTAATGRRAATKLVGIAQAAPPDGDNRSPRPELWWDPGGGAVMQVVEWQHGDEAGWGSSELQLVPDTGGRARTRVRAEFATGGAYRWRVWSVGGDGAMVISPWRRLNIVR